MLMQDGRASAFRLKLNGKRLQAGMKTKERKECIRGEMSSPMISMPTFLNLESGHLQIYSVMSREKAITAATRCLAICGNGLHRSLCPTRDLSPVLPSTMIN